MLGITVLQVWEESLSKFCWPPLTLRCGIFMASLACLSTAWDHIGFLRNAFSERGLWITETFCGVHKCGRNSDQIPAHWNTVCNVLLFLFLQWGETVSLRNWASHGVCVHPQMIREWMWSGEGMTLTGKTKELGEKPARIQIYKPQTRASAVRSRRLSAWTMARSFIMSYLENNNFISVQLHVVPSLVYFNISTKVVFLHA
jgi:hypothetical protein